MMGDPRKQAFDEGYDAGALVARNEGAIWRHAIDPEPEKQAAWREFLAENPLGDAERDARIAKEIWLSFKRAFLKDAGPEYDAIGETLAIPHLRGDAPVTSAQLIALLDDPKIAGAVNEKGSGRHA